jgi:hypothetical protein
MEQDILASVLRTFTVEEREKFYTYIKENNLTNTRLISDLTTPYPSIFTFKFNNFTTAHIDTENKIYGFLTDLGLKEKIKNEMSKFNLKLEDSFSNSYSFLAHKGHLYPSYTFRFSDTIFRCIVTPTEVISGTINVSLSDATDSL